MLPDGGIAKRVSESRTYAYAVAIQHTEAYQIGHLDHAIAVQETLIAQYRAVIAGEQPPFGQLSKDRYPEFLADSEERLARHTAERAAVNGPKPWAAVAWSSRLDLAQKEAAKYAKWGMAVRIVPAEVS